jgi:hypothetical protein
MVETEQLEELVPIPKCAYLIRRGEQPRSDRSNIFAWTPPPYGLAARPKEFEPFLGELPALNNKAAASIQADLKAMRHTQIVTAFESLQDEDFVKGVPKLSSVARLSGVVDLGAAELVTIWQNHAKKGV